MKTPDIGAPGLGPPLRPRISVEDLLAAKNTPPMRDLADVAADTFDSDEELQEFLTFTRAERHRDLARSPDREFGWPSSVPCLHSATMNTNWADGVTRVAVLTGAGISTDSGIPDYRGPSGVWTQSPDLVAAFTYDSFMGDPAVRARFWQTYLGHAAWQAKPNAAHRALAGLERSGAAVRILTQNVDGLHQKAGSSGRKVLELHGTMHEVVCTGCHVRTSSDATLVRVADGDIDPRCTVCGGILKLAVVLFGERLDPSTVGHAKRIAAQSGLMLAVGSSLQVDPAASLCAVAVEAGHRLVIVNRDPTPYDDLSVEVIREPIGLALPRICAILAANASTTSRAPDPESAV